MHHRLCFALLAALTFLPRHASGAPAPDLPPSDSRGYGSVEERRLLQSLEEERSSLASARESLAERENDLKRLENEVDKKLDELARRRQEIEDMLAKKSEEEQQRIKSLARMYEKMAPEKAARLIVSLDEELAIAIIANMKNKAAAKIFNVMEKDKGSRLSSAFSTLHSQ